jgi:hypothetical protein
MYPRIADFNIFQAAIRSPAVRQAINVCKETLVPPLTSVTVVGQWIVCSYGLAAPG